MAGTGPSLNLEVTQACKGLRAIAVNDAHRLMPWADVLYACDAAWWHEYDGMLDFAGERWSSHSQGKDEKLKCGERWGLKLIAGKYGTGFSHDPTYLNYGNNSGFQAMNLAMHFGAARILLIGFNMHSPEGKRHFFGNHPKELRNSDARTFVKTFDQAAQLLKNDKNFKTEIINCTDNTALKCFKCMPLIEAIALPPCAAS